jgi:hypothetical protein
MCAMRGRRAWVARVMILLALKFLSCLSLCQFFFFSVKKVFFFICSSLSFPFAFPFFSMIYQGEKMKRKEKKSKTSQGQKKATNKKAAIDMHKISNTHLLCPFIQPFFEAKKKSLIG